MAAFCKQCSIAIFGVDNKELASPAQPDSVHVYTICEDCGLTVVNKAGECIGACLKKHGELPVQSLGAVETGQVSR